MSSDVSWPAPVLDPWTAPFWDAVRDRRLIVQRCASCGTHRYPPGPCCRQCLSQDATWEEASGLGTVESWVIFHQAYFTGLKPVLPYNVALVRLSEGVPFMTNLVGIEPGEIRVGLPVRLVFEDVPGAGVLPRFTPRAAEQAR